MQTLKEYLAIIIIAAIALFIEINFLHPEKYKSFRIIDYYDEEVYDTIAVDTVEVEVEIDSEDIPCVGTSENNGIKATRDYLYRGSAPSLSGRICIVEYFINERGDGWTESERNTATSKVYEAEAWLKDKAVEYGTEVEFVTVSYGKNYCVDNIPGYSDEDDKNDKLLNKVFRSLNWTDHEAFVKHMREKYECDGVVILVMAKAVGRSWACPYTRSHEEYGKTQNFAEGAIIFNTKRFRDGSTAPLYAATVAHEILHLCGAWDFYEEKGIQDKEHASKAEKLFPKSIMLHENKDIYSCQLDEVTAWLVGIGSKKDWYVWFQPQS